MPDVRLILCLVEWVLRHANLICDTGPFVERLAFCLFMHHSRPSKPYKPG